MALMKQDITVPVNDLATLLDYMSAYEKDTTGRTCVVVLDVYSGTWGACDALKSTFKDICIQEVDDQVVSIKFLQVNSTDVLADIAQRASPDPPLPPSSMKRPPELLKDIMPGHWKTKFEGQQGKAKPLFLFYKDCQYINMIEGVNTPYIKRIIKQLIKEKKPASEFITNPDLLEMWTNEFGVLESEIPWGKFCNVVNVWCLFAPGSPSFNDEETKTLMTALNVEKGGMPMVTAKNLQDWVGEGKFDAVFRETLPNYETRVSEERERREKEEKEAAKKKAEEPPPDAKVEEKPAPPPDAKAEEEAPKPEEKPAAPEEEPAAEAPAEAEAAGAPSPTSAGNLATRVACFGEDAVESGVPSPLCTAEEMQLHGSFTLAAWIRPADGAAYDETRTNSDLAIVGCGDTDKEDGYFFLSLRAMTPFASFNNPAAALTHEGGALPEAAWSHLGVTYDSGSRSAALFVNGAKVADQVFPEGTGVGPETKVVVGVATYSSDCNTAFMGKIAGLKVVAEVSEDAVLKSFEDKSLCKDDDQPQKEASEKQAATEDAKADAPPDGELKEANETGDSYHDDMSPGAPPAGDPEEGGKGAAEEEEKPAEDAPGEAKQPETAAEPEQQPAAEAAEPAQQPAEAAEAGDPAAAAPVEPGAEPSKGDSEPQAAVDAPAEEAEAAKPAEDEAAGKTPEAGDQPAPEEPAAVEGAEKASEKAEGEEKGDGGAEPEKEEAAAEAPAATEPEAAG